MALSFIVIQFNKGYLLPWMALYLIEGASSVPILHKFCLEFLGYLVNSTDLILQKPISNMHIGLALHVNLPLTFPLIRLF